jgi:hypothetical protein
LCKKVKEAQHGYSYKQSLGRHVCAYNLTGGHSRIFAHHQESQLSHQLTTVVFE